MGEGNKKLCRMAYKILTAPAEEPISLDEAKAHLRVDIDADDGLIGGLIAAARERCEDEARRSFVERSMRVQVHQWVPTNALLLPQRPALSVTAVRVYDWENVAHVVPTADYWLGDDDRVRLTEGSGWPDVTVRPALGYEVEYVAGYGDATAVPQKYKQAVLLTVGHWYENREEVVIGQGYSSLQIPLGAASLLGIDRGSFF